MLALLRFSGGVLVVEDGTSCTVLSGVEEDVGLLELDELGVEDEERGGEDDVGGGWDVVGSGVQT